MQTRYVTFEVFVPQMHLAVGMADLLGEQLAQTRLARVLIAQGKADEALALLDPAKAGAFAALVHDIRGDALSAKGDAPGAQKEYQAALAAATGPDSGIDREFLEQKRDALGAPAAAASAQPAPANVPATTEVPAK